MRPPLELFGERRDVAGRYVARDALNAPHRKESIRRADKQFTGRDCVRSIIEGKQIKAAQIYSGSVDRVEHAPTFFTRLA